MNMETVSGRRDFLRRLTLTAAGLLVADDVLEQLIEPRRKLWAGADFRGEYLRDLFAPTDYVAIVSGSNSLWSVDHLVHGTRITLKDLRKAAAEIQRVRSQFV